MLFCGYRTTTSKCGHHHNGCVHWALPAATRYAGDELLNAEANDGRFDVRQMSVLQYLKAREYVVDDKVWKYLNKVCDNIDWSHLEGKLGEDTSKVCSPLFYSYCSLRGVMNAKLRFHGYSYTRLGKCGDSGLLSTSSEVGTPGI